MSAQGPDRETYWCARDSEKCVAGLLARVKTYRDALQRSGRTERMVRAWSSYHGQGVDGQKSSARLLPGGEQGELQMIAPPVFATLVRQTERLLTGQKPAYKTRASNSDTEAIVEAMLGDGLLDYYDRTAALTQRENEAVRSGLLLGSGYVVLGWNTATGKTVAVDPESNKEFREGDVQVRTFTPWDVAFDAQDADAESRQWFAFRTRAKKFDLIASKPELKDEILRAVGDNDDSMAEQPYLTPWREDVTASEDNVWVWELRHSRTAALPNGRLLRFISKDCVLYDSADVDSPTEAPEGSPADEADVESPAEESSEDAGFPYPDLLAYEFSPETVLGTGMGHSAHFDLLAMQEAIEAIATAGMTNINMGAVTNWWVQPGDAPNVQRLSTGANIVQSKTKPETIDGVQISPAMMAYLEMLRGLMREAVGINDVAAGETPKGMPAQLAALMEAKAIQYHQGGQAAYYKLVERVRTGVLKLLQRFATEPRVVELVGKAQSWALKTWSNKDISRVTKVVVEPVNPMMKTFAGRVSMVEMMGPALGPDAKMSLMLTGSLEQKLDGPKAHEGRLAAEKDLLREGKGMPPVDIEASMMAAEQAMATGAPDPGPVFMAVEGEFIRPLKWDRHWIDIPEYLSIIESPSSRANGAVVTAVLDLCEEKLRLWKMMDPDVLSLLGGPPAPSSMMAAMMPPEAPGAPPDAKGAPNPAAMPTDDTTRPVSMPKPPKNPLTGEQSGPPV